MNSLLLVTPERFAEIACMDGMAFGVNTNCNPCDEMLNACMRRHLREALEANQQKTELTLGYNLTKRYHSHEFAWDGKSRVQLPWAGVKAVNVRPKITRVSESPVTINPYVAEASLSQDGGVCVVSFSRALVDNPDLVTLRDKATGAKIEISTVAGYPRRNGNNWQVAIIGNCNDLGDIVVQHCKYIAVTIMTPTCNGDVYAVQTGTETIIPFAKEPTVSGNDTTYWFYAWSLIDPAFEDDALIDLDAGQFYKLLPDLEFICVTDEYAPPILIYEKEALCEIQSTRITPVASSGSGTADLSIEVIASDNNPQPGQSVTFAVFVHNAGPDTATSVTVTSLLPSGYTLENYAVSQGTYVSSSGVWAVGTLLAEQEATLVIEATVKASGVYEHSAKITGGSPADPDSDDTEDKSSLEIEASNLKVDLLFPVDGIISLKDPLNRAPIKVRVYYKTDPDLLNVVFGDIEMAIAYLTAADLPEKACNCEFKTGFISEAKKATTYQENSDGQSVAFYKYGNFFGHKKYADLMDRAKKQDGLVFL